MNIKPLSHELSEELESKRSWVRNHYAENSNELYNTLDGKLNLLTTILKNNWIKKGETIKFQCLGITFGDALIQYIDGMKWVEYSDEHGIDPALQYENTSIIIFPQTMISKRIEDNVEVNIPLLLEETSAEIYRIISDLNIVN